MINNLSHFLKESGDEQHFNIFVTFSVGFLIHLLYCLVNFHILYFLSVPFMYIKGKSIIQ